MTRSATDFSRSCRAPPLGAPGAAGASGGWVFLDVHEFESKSALGPGGNRGPGPSTPSPGSRLLALPARPWLRPFPLVLFGDEVRRVSSFFPLDSPPRGREFPLRLQRSARPFLLRSYASWGQGGGRGCSSGGERERGLASPVPSLGEQASLLSRLVACSPIPWLLAKD